MMFCYWHGTERGLIREGFEAWRHHFPDFRVIGDSDIEPIIARRFPAHLDAYRKIRIPACKSDIARLVALHEWGGLYVDCHCGVGDAKLIDQLLGDLDTFELIVLDEDPRGRQPNVDPMVLNPMNGIIFAQKNSNIIFEWAKMAFRNLADHRNNEQERGYCSYCIWSLTGASVLMDIVMDSGPPALKEHYANRVKIIPERLSPVIRDVHGAYRRPGMHWHEREKRELLFD